MNKTRSQPPAGGAKPYGWHFDPLAPERVQITFKDAHGHDIPFAETSTLKNAQSIADTLNSHAQLTADNAALREGLKDAAELIESLTGAKSYPKARALLSGQPAQDKP